MQLLVSTFFFCRKKKVEKEKPPRANASSARPAFRIHAGPRLPGVNAHVFLLRQKAGLPPPPVARGTTPTFGSTYSSYI